MDYYTFQYPIEEYRITQKRIDEYESSRYKILFFNATSFAAIIGFRQEIPDQFIPFLFLLFLTLCSAIFSSQTQAQRRACAYIIARYESQKYGIYLQTGFLRSYQIRRPKVPTLESIFRSLIHALLLPFSVLIIISILSGFLITSDFIVEIYKDNKIHGIMYVTTVLALHLPAIRYNIVAYSRTLSSYVEWWIKELNKKGLAPLEEEFKVILNR